MPGTEVAQTAQAKGGEKVAAEARVSGTPARPPHAAASAEAVEAASKAKANPNAQAATAKENQPAQVIEQAIKPEQAAKTAELRPNPRAEAQASQQAEKIASALSAASSRPNRAEGDKEQNRVFNQAQAAANKQVAINQSNSGTGGAQQSVMPSTETIPESRAAAPATQSGSAAEAMASQRPASVNFSQQNPTAGKPTLDFKPATGDELQSSLRTESQARPSGSAPTAEASGPRAHQLSAALERHLDSMQANNRSTVRVALDLPGGERLQVSLRATAQGVQVRFSGADDAQLRQDLSQAWSRLSSNAASRGIQLAHPQFDQQGGDANARQSQNQQAQQDLADGRRQSSQRDSREQATHRLWEQPESEAFADTLSNARPNRV